LEGPGAENMSSKRKDSANKRRGMVIITVAALSVVFIGFLGLSIDLGRVYITKRELQNYGDAAAFAAALRLNGLQ
jgi:uncharacterized membrane protein